MNLSELSEKDLLRLQASATNELLGRNVVRTQNNPLGDYTEWLVSKALGLDLQSNSKAGYDGTDSDGLRYQIKGRRITPKNQSRQLSAIRNYDGKDFDILVAVIYDENFDVIEAVQCPHEVIADYAKYRSHVNAHILILKGPVLSDPRVESITLKLKS
ncbi:DUF6998 domain-containing protein [Vibrio breoganii]|uniref:DUF6998 domain-containing protein n=1 Tax=Vibrio breoganii TaxID=553239 RepID=UPI000C84F9AA|nr:hypothetical protein [Vibrio breoganii]PMK16160.1 hypothetical protein BCU06_12745 [Vibrio breoganii]